MSDPNTPPGPSNPQGSPPPPPPPPPPGGPYPAGPVPTPYPSGGAAPYGGPPTNPYDAAPQPNPYGQPPQANPYGQPPPPGSSPMAPIPGSLPYVQTYFGPVADFGARALAYLIDGVLVLLGVIPMIIGIAVLSMSSANDPYGEPSSGASALGLLLIFGGMVAMFGIGAWNRWWRMGTTGQSIGKKQMGLKLIDANTGAPIGAGRAFLRDILNSAANQIIYLGFLWMLWDNDRQTLGDKGLSSTVIRVAK